MNHVPESIVALYIYVHAGSKGISAAWPWRLAAKMQRPGVYMQLDDMPDFTIGMTRNIDKMADEDAVLSYT